MGNCGCVSARRWRAAIFFRGFPRSPPDDAQHRRGRQAPAPVLENICTRPGAPAEQRRLIDCPQVKGAAGRRRPAPSSDPSPADGVAHTITSEDCGGWVLTAGCRLQEQQVAVSFRCRAARLAVASVREICWICMRTGTLGSNVQWHQTQRGLCREWAV